MERWSGRAALRGAAVVGGSAALMAPGFVFPGMAHAKGTVTPASCSDTARVAKQKDMIDGHGHTLGTVYLMYSDSCRTVWAKVLTGSPPCQYDGNYCGYATVHRNSDNFEDTCFIPIGQSGCVTAMLDDANVTSFAYAEFDNYPNHFYGKTESY